jgi:hypothetical protein
MMRAFFFLITTMALADPAVIHDFKTEWRVYGEQGYQPADASAFRDETTIYFTLDTRRFGGQQLEVNHRDAAYVLADGQFIGPVGSGVLLSVDSLREAFGEIVLIAVHTTGRLPEVETRIVGGVLQGSTDPMALVARPPTYFRDFGILVAAFLVVFFLLLFRGNPQLTLDYFTFSKIFSSSERNETQLASRITSSENLLFYLFSALLTGFLLSVILFSAGPFFPAAVSFQFGSFTTALLVMGRLSLFILLLLAAKLVIVLIFSTLFNFRDTISFQFFNFLRFVLFTGVVLSTLSILFFVFRIDSPAWYERLIGLGLLMLTTGSVMVLRKLLRRSHFSFFHLFSYLCVSEFIPLVILFKLFL